jgi:hypothetical protein
MAGIEIPLAVTARLKVELPLEPLVLLLVPEFVLLLEELPVS